MGGDLVWSAAYAPPAATPTATPPAPDRSANAYEMMSADSRDDNETAVPDAVPSPPACLPDAPGGYGCPLYVPGTTMLSPDSDVDCAKVCDEYHTCLQPTGAQAGFTCDARYAPTNATIATSSAPHATGHRDATYPK